MTDFNAMTDALVSCDAAKLTDLVNQALSADVPAQEILNKGLIAGMDIVGEKMESGDMFIPEVLMAAQAMGGCVEILKPLLGDGEGAAAASVIIGTVKGDLHDIGKNLCAMMLKGAGFEVMDLGVDCDVEKYKEAVDGGAQVVLLSALLTTTMPYMKEVVDGLSGSDAKILIGGAPVTQDYANEIGADGYSDDANTAVGAAKTALGIAA